MQWDTFKDTLPRKAAAVIVVQGDGDDLEILLGQRNTAIMFMGGHHVFPGGSIDKADTHTVVTGITDEEQGRGICAAAREVFEETGLLALPEADWPDEATRIAARHALLKNETNFPDILNDWGLKIEGGAFQPAGVWVTPPMSPIRFDTQYYLYQHKGSRTESIVEDDPEIVSLDWLSPQRAREQWHEGTLKISTPVAFVLQHLTALCIEDALPLLQHTPHSDDIPRCFEMRRGIHLMPVESATLPPATHTNCVVVGEEELYVFDPGCDDPKTQTRLEEDLERLCALGAHVAAVVLTHSHPDHIGAVAHLKEKFNAQVWAHADAGKALAVPIDRQLHDGDHFSIPGTPGWEIEVIHTPGHASDHLAFFESTTRTLIAGDLIANPGTILISPDYGGDMAVYLESMEEILEKNYSMLMPGHGFPFFGAHAKEAVQELVQHRLDREQKIVAAIEGGASTHAEIIAVAYDDTPEEAWPLAEHQLRAHLIKLDITLNS